MHTLRLLAGCIAIGSMGLTAVAQDGQPKNERPPVRPARPDGPPGDRAPRELLSPEKAKAAWTVEATGVAKHVGASDDQAKAVVIAYAAARESQAKASEKTRQELMEKAQKAGGDDGGPGGRGGLGAEGMKAMEEINAKEREKLHKALAATLSADQTTKAMASLGTFNRQWDLMVDTIVGFGLDGAKQQDALNAIEEFVVVQGKIRPGAGAAGGGDREAMRSAMQESRQKLNDSMKKVLSADQLTKFEEATRGGGRGPGGPGGPRGGGRGGDNKGGDNKGGGGG
jgi:hypothetical protein